MEAWVAGLMGAAVGAASSFAGVWVQSHYQNRREVLKLVVDAAVKDRNDQIDLALKIGRGGRVAPIALFVHYHMGLTSLISRRKLNTKSLNRLHAENRKMSRLIRELDEQRREDEL